MSIYRKTSEIYHIQRQEGRKGDDNPSFLIQTVPDDIVTCRSRFEKIKPVEENLNVEKLLADNGYVYPNLMKKKEI